VRLKQLGGRLRFANLMVLGLVVVLVGMCAFLAHASPYFLTVRNLLNIGSSLSILGVTAVGLTIVMIGGGLDLTITAVMMATAMVTAALIIGGTPEWLAALIGCGAAMAMGAGNGLLVAKARVNPIVATLSTMSIIRGVGYIISKGAFRGLAIGIDQFALLARSSTIPGIPNALLCWLVACGVGAFILRFTLFGQHVFAVGDSAAACQVSGVHVDRCRLLTYVIGGLASGIAGLMLLSLSTTAYAQQAAGEELNVIAAVILGGVGLSGGRGGVAGTMLAMLILGVMQNGMTLTGVPDYWQYIVRGLILMLAVGLDSLRSGGGYR